MAKGGKTGGGRSGGTGGGKRGGGTRGGKGGGGKKPGRGCAPGQVTLCLFKADYDVITAAFKSAIQSRGISDGCTAGLMRVCLDLSIAQKLMLTIFNASQGITKKKKKGKKGKVRKGA
jgi:hypothetical protein